jgi:hypothetical protein
MSALALERETSHTLMERIGCVGKNAAPTTCGQRQHRQRDDRDGGLSRISHATYSLLLCVTTSTIAEGGIDVEAGVPIRSLQWDRIFQLRGMTIGKDKLCLTLAAPQRRPPV